MLAVDSSILPKKSPTPEKPHIATDFRQIKLIFSLQAVVKLIVTIERKNRD
jgi:hypothetical protein